MQTSLRGATTGIFQVTGRRPPTCCDPDSHGGEAPYGAGQADEPWPGWAHSPSRPAPAQRLKGSLEGQRVGSKPELQTVCCPRSLRQISGLFQEVWLGLTPGSPSRTVLIQVLPALPALARPAARPAARGTHVLPLPVPGSAPLSEPCCLKFSRLPRGEPQTPPLHSLRRAPPSSPRPPPAPGVPMEPQAAASALPGEPLGREGPAPATLARSVWSLATPGDGRSIPRTCKRTNSPSWVLGTAGTKTTEKRLLPSKQGLSQAKVRCSCSRGDSPQAGRSPLATDSSLEPSSGARAHSSEGKAAAGKARGALAKACRVCRVAKSLKSFLFVLLVVLSHHGLPGAGLLCGCPPRPPQPGGGLSEHPGLLPLSARPAGSIKNSLSS